MVGYVDERTSRAAIWCQRFAVFLLPFFGLIILLFRFGKIDLIQMFTLVAIGLLIALLALVLALNAVVELWSKGYRGGSRVVRGLIITLMVLSPFAYFAYLSLLFPLANDVSTNPYAPPDYVTAGEIRASQSSDGMNPVGDYDLEHAEKIVVAYPKLQSRRYPAGPERVLEAVQAIIIDNEWPVTGSNGIPETKVEGAEEPELADNTDDEKSLEDNVKALDDIYVEFIQRTLVFGFENDIVIRIVSEDQNTLIDMRASSRWGLHDFGYNAKFIENFQSQLDAALLGIAGEG